MIITWNTDPSKGTFAPGSGKYSSYYQYDTVSGKFVRVRLELGRAASQSGGDSGGTGAFFTEKRYVGFGPSDSARTSQPTRWSINDKGELCFDGAALATKPSAGLTTFDTSSTTFTDSTFIHRGNPVTETPNYPEGIRAAHLSLIANDAIINQASTRNITAATASSDDLIAALKTKIGVIVDKPFTEITNDDLLACLKTQVAQIKTESIAPSKESLDSCLDTVDELIEGIKSEIRDKGLVPDEDFTAAFDDLAAKYEAAKTASATGKDVSKSIKELSEAKTALNKAVTTIDEQHQASLENQLDASEVAIEAAQIDSETWEGIDSEYEEAEKSTSLDEYEESIGNDEVVEAR